MPLVNLDVCYDAECGAHRRALEKRRVAIEGLLPRNRTRHIHKLPIIRRVNRGARSSNVRRLGRLQRLLGSNRPVLVPAGEGQGADDQDAPEAHLPHGGLHLVAKVFPRHVPIPNRGVLAEAEDVGEAAEAIVVLGHADAHVRGRGEGEEGFAASPGDASPQSHTRLSSP
eukprot:CAMPEP_0169465426 /NCGR_PEP_ID=MMETSP1042-20121227/21208_1 /TAXON_ID=464988 /ORGANISM="Hemiselmis andersenii, Strain CCMP1180" /LENGTH=169 /DNA_ID=CAMNT_0009578371 /DNA_START=1033 /DNA_END=1538 /DNA_ORIENTATION=-